MRNKNVWVLIGVAVFIAVVGILAACGIFDRTPMPTADSPVLPTEQPTEPPVTVTAPDGETQTPSPQPSAEQTENVTPTPVPVADAYLIVTVGETVYQPVALTQEGEYTVNQPATGAQNVIHVTPDSVTMQSATCENQDCVEQGTVTLANKDTRLLSNMIVCLPNQVTLALYTRDELTALLGGGQ